MGKNWKYNPGLYSVNPIFYLVHELGKLRSPSGATFKNPKMFLWIGKNLKVQPKTNSQNPKFGSMDELGKVMS